MKASLRALSVGQRFNRSIIGMSKLKFVSILLLCESSQCFLSNSYVQFKTLVVRKTITAILFRAINHFLSLVPKSRIKSIYIFLSLSLHSIFIVLVPCSFFSLLCCTSILYKNGNGKKTQRKKMVLINL